MTTDTNFKSETFLLAAYNEKHSTLSKIRERAYNTTRLISLGFFAFGGFLVTEVAGPLSTEQKAVAVLGVIFVVGICIYLLEQWYQTLGTILSIIANLEIAMGFHDVGEYLPDKKLFPDSVASAEQFAAGEYDKNNKIGYRSIVIVSGFFAIGVVLLVG
ncbi:MAG: hypothetical protein AAGB04_24570 [Pseudomonadota bacterium]